MELGTLAITRHGRGSSSTDGVKSIDDAYLGIGQGTTSGIWVVLFVHPHYLFIHPYSTEHIATGEVPRESPVWMNGWMNE